ncbi:hypothetical protein LA6_002665 [Marinibacterium anthonyi]|nr:hypothetical protein LA6_002665 [Marinibacterium anthonyi]
MSKTPDKFPPEVPEHAVRVVLDNPGQHGFLWGDREALTDVTTYQDTGRFTAAVAVDDRVVPSAVQVAGKR